VARKRSLPSFFISCLSTKVRKRAHILSLGGTTTFRRYLESLTRSAAGCLYLSRYLYTLSFASPRSVRICCPWPSWCPRLRIDMKLLDRTCRRRSALLSPYRILPRRVNHFSLYTRAICGGREACANLIEDSDGG
jgi:hypothetical protein